MKRTYSSPKIRKIALRSMSLLANSPTISYTKNSGDTTKDVLSNERSASDNIWGDE